MLNGRSAAGLTGLIVALAACGPTVPPDQKASADVRHIRPDTQVTMDYRAARLNIDIDAAGVVTGVRCG